MARKLINGRPALDRAGVCELTGRSEVTVTYWAGNRDTTGYPLRCNPGGGKEWVWEDEVTRFWTAHQQAKANAHTDIDRSGDPDELVGPAEAVRILNWRTPVRNPPGYLLEHPDEVKELPSGRLRRRWKRKTVWHYAEIIRPERGGGRPPGARPRAPHRYATDPRLDEVIAMLNDAETAALDGNTRGLGYAVAQRLGVSEVTASRLLSAARQARQTGNSEPQ